MKGQLVTLGYLDDPEATAEAHRDGWLWTGDVGVMSDDGYIRIVDRSKDLIITGGFNVYPNEVEQAVCEHPAVQEAAVIGVRYIGKGDNRCIITVITGRWRGEY